MKNPVSGESILKGVFISLPFLYILLFARYGFESYDTGYILGVAWQFFTGSTPYSEIIYVYPPISYMFHALVLFFGEYSVIIDRILCYIEIAVYSYLSSYLLFIKFYLNKKSYFYLVSILSFIFSVHTFPPMAWYTIDGIFFSTIGIYLLLIEERMYSLYIGSFFVVIGALCKQSFYFVPFFVLLYFSVLKRRGLLKLSMILLSLASVVFLYFYRNNLLYEFVNKTTGVTKTTDLIHSGFFSYIARYKSFATILIPPFLVGLFFKKNICIIYTLFFSVLSYTLLKYAISEKYIIPSWIDVLFLVACFFALYQFYELSDQKYAIILLLLSVSWCSGISWGYQTTVLFSAPAIFILTLPIYNNFDSNFSYKIWTVFFILSSFFTFYIGYQYPYNLSYGMKRKELIYNMDDIYKKLKYIKGDKNTYFEYQEIKQHISKLKDKNKFVVFPATPLIHYLSGTINPIGIDWALNAIVNDQFEKIIKILEDKKTTVFVRNIEVAENGKFGSKITLYIKKKWKKIDTDKYYDTYFPN